MRSRAKDLTCGKRGGGGAYSLSVIWIQSWHYRLGPCTVSPPAGIIVKDNGISRSSDSNDNDDDEDNDYDDR